MHYPTPLPFLEAYKYLGYTREGLPVIARRAVAADILAARREGMTEQRRQQAASAKAGSSFQAPAQPKAMPNSALVQIQAELLEGAEPAMIA